MICVSGPLIRAVGAEIRVISCPTHPCWRQSFVSGPEIYVIGCLIHPIWCQIFLIGPLIHVIRPKIQPICGKFFPLGVVNSAIFLRSECSTVEACCRETLARLKKFHFILDTAQGQEEKRNIR